MLIRASSKLITVESPMQYRGRDVRGSTFADNVKLVGYSAAAVAATNLGKSR